MKKKPNAHEPKLPRVILRDFKKHKTEYEDVEQFVSDNVMAYLMNLNGKLVNKDMAIFLSDYETNIENAPCWGGYRAWEQMTFEDGGNKYTVLAFGWNDENEIPDIRMLAYKER